MNDKKKKFKKLFIVWICIFAIGLVKKALQNDTLYTIKIGELILKNGIDMMDHFSFHTNLMYTYPHWLYDIFIYIIYHFLGFTGIYISSILLFLLLLTIIFKVNYKLCERVVVAAVATFICTLAISSFVTARAQLVSFILFALEIYFIEMILKTGKKKYGYGLLLISLLICNIHVAVWPFYFILFLPYLAEAFITWLSTKSKLLKKILEKKFAVEKNKNIKYLLIIILLSLFTGLLTPIGDTPYTYLIKTMMGNSQSYIQEHQMISWINSPFTIIIAFETLFLTAIAKVKMRDLFMVLGLTLMSVFSIRHISLLALIGTICFARVFSTFLDKTNVLSDDTIIKFLSKKYIVILAFILVISLSTFSLSKQLKKPFLDESFYPIEATNYILENINIDEMKIFNEYNFGSYLLYKNIPVFIDSRADLYTKQFSGFEYDIFDDYEYIMGNYQVKFDFYGITHVLLYKNSKAFYDVLNNDINYKLIYEDEYYGLFERTKNNNYVITFS